MKKIIFIIAILFTFTLNSCDQNTLIKDVSETEDLTLKSYVDDTLGTSYRVYYIEHNGDYALYDINTGKVTKYIVNQSEILDFFAIGFLVLSVILILMFIGFTTLN